MIFVFKGAMRDILDCYVAKIDKIASNNGLDKGIFSVFSVGKHRKDLDCECFPQSSFYTLVVLVIQRYLRQCFGVKMLISV